MALFTRLVIAFAGGLVALAVLLVFFAYLLTDEPAVRRSDVAAGRTAATDAWLGRWNGPEGTFLLLEKAGGEGYSVTVQNLDGPRVFRGTAIGDRIEFDRDGVTKSVRPTDGAATGMKWLADKADCLTIRYGEGYCRD
jgi:hypothetical protein